MNEHEKERPVIKVPVRDRRRTADPEAPGRDMPGHEAAADLSPPASNDRVQEPDDLGDLQRVQAEYANYRKRIMREQAEIGERAVARFVERLLPVLDNFERAISHGEGGEGVRLVLKELEGVLAAEGIEEIAAEGQSFDPNFHHAVESIEDAQVAEPVVTAVHVRGWKAGDRVIRPAMVRVAKPVEVVEDSEELVVDEPGDEEG